MPMTRKEFVKLCTDTRPNQAEYSEAAERVMNEVGPQWLFDFGESIAQIVQLGVTEEDIGILLKEAYRCTRLLIAEREKERS